MNCPFRMKLRTTSDGQKLIVTDFNEDHNHDTNEVRSVLIIIGNVVGSVGTCHQKAEKKKKYLKIMRAVVVAVIVTNAGNNSGHGEEGISFRKSWLSNSQCFNYVTGQFR